MARVSIEVEDKLLHALKVHTAYTKSNIKDFVTKSIENQIKYENSLNSPISKNMPNAETIRVFEDTDKGIGLTRYASLKDLYKDLGIDD